MDVPATELALCVGESEAGLRLDAFLAARLGVSRAEARRLLQGGAVRLGGRRPRGIGKGLRLAPGAQVEVRGFTPPAARRAPDEPGRPLALLAEGPGWLAVDKPPGCAVHPLREHERGTLLGAVLARRPEIHGVGEGGLRSGVVHRLDVDTSGVVVFASEEPQWRRLRLALQEGRVEKLYRAVVLGRPEEQGRLELALAVTRHRPARVRVVEPGARGARRAALRWRTLEVLGEATLLEVRLETGFLHQIRASFAHLGHAVAGDRAYGPQPDPTQAPRQLLHAWRFGFEEIAAESADPRDFAEALERLRGRS